MARQMCKKRVFSGERWDVAGHTCGNGAKEGSDFCHLHGDKAPEEDPRRDALTPPTGKSSQQTTYYASLDWDSGQGPVVKAPYRKGYGFITRVVGIATDDRIEVKAFGAMRKKDGTVGTQRWDTYYGIRAGIIPEDALAQLHALLAQERAK